MDIADLGDREALKLLRKIGQRHVHIDHRSHAARHEKPHLGDRRCERHHADRRHTSPGLVALRRERKGRHHQAHVAKKGEDQQPREETHGERRKQYGPRTAILPNSEPLGQ